MPTATYLKRDKVQTIEQGVTTLYVKLTTGSTGAVSASSGYGLTSITRTGTGAYTILLDRKYKKLLSCNATFVQGTPQGLGLAIVTDSISSAGSIAITTNVTATATDPSSGSVILFAITVADTGLTGGVS